MKIILKEELAFHWCRLNDPDSFYKNWPKERVYGAKLAIEAFLTKKELQSTWKKYHLKHQMMIRLQKRILSR